MSDAKNLTLHYNARFSKILHWGKLITITGAAQMLVQAIGLISGIIIIRLLPTEEYALYTLVNTMLGTMTLLADGGISAGVLSQGGLVWQDRTKLGIVLSTGIALRKKFALLSLVIAVPVLLYLLRHHGASLFTSILIVASLIPAFFAALSDSLLEIVPKLHQDIKPLQKNQLGVNFGRLFLTAVTLFFFPWAFVAIIAAGLPRSYGNIKLRKIADNYIEKGQKSDPIVSKEILKVVKRILPGAIYYSFSGQITIWLISIFGRTTGIAQVGALGRISMLLTVFGTIISTLVIPRFARLKRERKVLISFYAITKLLILIVLVGFVILTYLFSHPLLWILGSKYYGLEHELNLTIIGSCISLFAGLSFQLYSSRGWAMLPLVLIILDVSSIVMGLLLFNLSSIDGVLELNIFTSSCLLLINVCFMLYKIFTS
jgi:O-antigen/teichoic acid export membrane protein